MENIAQATLAVALLAIIATMLWALLAGLGRFLKDDGPLPFYGMIERQGLTLRQVEEAVGMDNLAHAVRRCMFCAARPDCKRQAAVCCPNEPLLRRARGERATA